MQQNTTQRESKGETERKRRRKRGSGVTGQRLGVNSNLLDHSKFVYRWINDDPARIYAMTNEDDWDLVKDPSVKDDNTDLGSAVSIVVGTNAEGKGKRAYLCQKLKTFFDEDQAAKQADLDEQLDQLMRGNSRSGEAQGDYVPSSGINQTAA